MIRARKSALAKIFPSENFEFLLPETLDQAAEKFVDQVRTMNISSSAVELEVKSRHGSARICLGAKQNETLLHPFGPYLWIRLREEHQNTIVSASLRFRSSLAMIYGVFTLWLVVGVCFLWGRVLMHGAAAVRNAAFGTVAGIAMLAIYWCFGRAVVSMNQSRFDALGAAVDSVRGNRRV